jgi:peroxiredoxin
MTQPLASLEDAFAECAAMDVPLRDQLAALSRRISPAHALPVEALIARLRASHIGAAAPRPGEAMPRFHLPDETGRMVALDDLLSRGPVAVVFHRGHWCPYCRMSARALAAAQGRVAAAGGQLVAILPERAAYAAKLKAESGAAYPFLSDMDNGYAMSLGLVFWMGRELAELHRANANDISRYQGNPGWIVPLPAIFVVARDGRVTARFVDPDYRQRMAIDDLVAAVAAASAAA